MIKPAPSSMDKVTALFLVSKGKANPEQQKLAYQHHLEMLSAQAEAAKRPAKQTKGRNSNLLVYMLLRYVENNPDDLEEAGSEATTKAGTYRFVAKQKGLQAGTIEREYKRWLSATPPDEREQQADEYLDQLIGSFYS